MVVIMQEKHQLLGLEWP